MSDIIYFEYMCHKHDMLRNYLHYLHPRQIKLLLTYFQPYKNKNIALEKVNKILETNYTESRIKKVLSDISVTLYRMHHHAKLFGIEKSVQQVSYEQLKEIVDKIDWEK